MSNTNRYRDESTTRGERGQPRGWNHDEQQAQGPHGAWTPYDDDRNQGELRDWTDERSARGRWEDTRMGMGDQWRGGDDRSGYRGRGWEASDFRAPQQGSRTNERDAREQWRNRNEASRAERTNRGNDDGPRYADDRDRDSYREDRYRDDRHDERGYRAHEDQRWSDDHYRGWHDEQDDMGDQPGSFRGEQRDWRPEPQRVMHDRDTQHGSLRRDESRMHGDWRREQNDWRPARAHRGNGEYRTGADDRWRDHATRTNERDWRGGPDREIRRGDLRDRDMYRNDMRGMQRDDMRGMQRDDTRRGDNSWRGNETRGGSEDYRRGSYGRDNPDARYSMEQRDWRARPDRDMHRDDMHRDDRHRDDRHRDDMRSDHPRGDDHRSRRPRH